MNDSHATPEAVEHKDAPDRGAKLPDRRKKRRSKSMHDGIAVWCDCCSCEAEPYWVAVAEELGVDLGSDFETASEEDPRSD